MSATVPRDGALPNTRRRILAACYGVVCHLCFLLGVGTMMAAMYFGMSRSLGGIAPPWNWIANAALLIQFPLVHSLLLTARGRALLGRLAPAGVGSTLSTRPTRRSPRCRCSCCSRSGHRPEPCGGRPAGPR